MPDNAYTIEHDLGIPSPYELLWTTTMSYCNVYRLTYKIFVGCGIPIPKQNIFSNDKIATSLIPTKLYDPSKKIYSTLLEFLRFRGASKEIEGFVFKAMNLQRIENIDDVKLGVVLWDSINDAMNKFMNDISILSNQVNKWIINFVIRHNATVDPTTMMIFLYEKIFDETVVAISKSTIIFRNAFDYLITYNPKFEANNNGRVRKLINH